MSPRVQLVGKPGCHLCDDAREIVSTACDELGVPWVEHSILDSPSLAASYAELIPVILVDGVAISYWFADGDQLRAALA